MSEKKAAIGVCDLCGEKFPAGVSDYTSKGTPRLYCSTTCQATANSRAGSEKRVQKVRARVAQGEWENPSPLVREDATPEEIAAWREKVGRGVAKMRRAEVERGDWRNPALDDAARQKLSRPRVHGDNPVLHSALEKLRLGATVSDLTSEEQEEHRAYQRRRRAARGEEVRARQRQRYRERMENDAEYRRQQRARARRQRHALEQRKPNETLRQARETAGVSQSALAEAVGVSQTTVSKWERFSVEPREEAVRAAVVAALGVAVWGPAQMNER